MPRPLAADVRGSARFSRDGRYRTPLTRAWGKGPRVAWVLLNPSTATAREDDPTLARCVAFARRRAHGSLEAVNLVALVAPSPAAMPAPPRAGQPADAAAAAVSGAPPLTPGSARPTIEA